MRILVSAYACEPEKGSEPGVGWNWVCHIACSHEVWVLTRANNRSVIETALEREPLPSLHFIYFDLPRWMCFWKKGRRGVHLYYYLWQVGAWFLAKNLHRQINFNVVHHVTLVNYWMPSFLALLPVPFIWGPVGGGESAPRKFFRSFTFRGKVYEILRDLARSFIKFDPFVRLTARRAVFAMAATGQTEQRLRALGCPMVSIVSQVALPDDIMRRLQTFPARHGHLFRLVSMGDLLHWKGFEFGIRAFALFQLRFPLSEYWLIGDGPERKRLQRLAQKLGVGEKVRFLGKLPRSQAMENLAQCDVLLHPSLHDSGAYVCAEAMAAGRPVICLDLGGPAVQVSDETGIKIAALSPQQVVGALAKAMDQLARDPLLREQLGTAARERVVQYFSWAQKKEPINRMYSSLGSDFA